jgi:hypothetical protein
VPCRGYAIIRLVEQNLTKDITMGVSRQIDLEIFVQGKTYFDCLEILLTYEWTPFGPNGEIVHLAVGDIDKFDFKTTSSLEYAYQVLSERQSRGEFGFLKIWDKQHEDDINLLIYPKEPTEIYNTFELHFSLVGAGKRLTEGGRYTDYSYYLRKIVPILEREGFLFGHIECCDVG